ESAGGQVPGLGVKASIAVTHRGGLIVGARSFPGNPYDGHILAAQLEQTAILLEGVRRTPKQVVVDLGYRGVDADNPGVQIIHRGRFKSMTLQQRRWLKRRQAIEPAIGHLKADHRMNRCWLAGSLGDALHAVLCAAGYNLRWLLRAVARGRIRRLFCALCSAALQWLLLVSVMLAPWRKRSTSVVAATG
ncbi:MAG TPA: transposase, partial [Rubrivivax sp.]|nr:transposase [Rubrivivax sp.]